MSLYVCVHTCMCTYGNAHVGVCSCECMCVHACVRAHVGVLVGACMCVHVWMLRWVPLQGPIISLFIYLFVCLFEAGPLSSWNSPGSPVSSGMVTLSLSHFPGHIAGFCD